MPPKEVSPKSQQKQFKRQRNLVELELESLAHEAVRRLNTTATRTIAENQLRQYITELIKIDALSKALVRTTEFLFYFHNLLSLPCFL